MYFIIFLIITAASFLFAMLGLGGGMVYVPVLKWFGLNVKEVAIPLGLLLNGLNTLFALIPFARARLVDWKGGAVMAATAFIASPLGAYSTRYIDADKLMILFAFMVLIAAMRMLFVSGQPEPDEQMSLKKRSIIGFVTGGFAGYMGGLLGLGGGFIIAPVLMWMGYKSKEAAATTAFVVTFSSFSGYLGHVSQGGMNWTLALILIVSVVIGSQLGGHFMAKKAKSKQIKLVYGLVLIAIAIKLFWGALS